MSNAKRKYRDAPLPGLDHFLLVIHGGGRSVTLAYPIAVLTLEFVIIEMNTGYVGFITSELPGGDLLPMIGAREVYRLKEAIQNGLIEVTQPTLMSAEAARTELFRDIDDAAKHVLGSYGASPSIH